MKDHYEEAVQIIKELKALGFLTIGFDSSSDHKNICRRADILLERLNK